MPAKMGKGRLRVGAAIGVHDYERAESLLAKDVDVLVVDSAHGHSANVIETVKNLKKRWDIDVVAGNVATAEGCRDLIAAGADAVKVGIGPGSICTTRVISGVGVPQITAIYEAAQAAAASRRADHRRRRHSLLGRHDQGARRRGARGDDRRTVRRPGRKPGRDRSCTRDERSKSIAAWVRWARWCKGSSERYRQRGAERRPGKLVPEGVEGRVPFKGPLSSFVYQLVGGLRAGMGYCGTQTHRGVAHGNTIHPDLRGRRTGESST